MPRVLISTNHLSNFTDSGLATLELVEQFLAEGWHIDVYANHFSGDVANAFTELLDGGRVTVSTDWDSEFQHEYDLLWIQQSVFNRDLLARLTSTGINTRIIFNHTSCSEELEMPVDIAVENRLADCVLAVSEACRDKLRGWGIAAEKIRLFANPAPDDFAVWGGRRGVAQEVKNILFIVHPMAQALLEAQAILSQSGINCTLIEPGQAGKLARITPETLAAYDVVVTSGKTVQYCLALGIPPYLYDHFGGEGYLDADNFSAAQHDNFCHCSGKRQLTAVAIANELQTGYQNASRYARDRQPEFSQSGRLSHQLQQLLASLPEKSQKHINSSEIFLFSREAFAQRLKRDSSMPEQGRTIQQFLERRVPSADEYAQIKDYLQQHPDGRSIAIFILDLAGNESGVRSTLNSLYTEQIQSVVKVQAVVFSVSGISADNGRFYPVSADNYIDVINQAVGEIDYDWLMLVKAGEQLAFGGLLMASQELLAASNCHAIYGDEIIIDDNGAANLSCRPDFNLDYLLSLPSVMGRHWLFNRQTLSAVGGFDKGFSGAPEFELIVRVIEQLGIGAIGHLDEYLVSSSFNSAQTLADEVRVLERHMQRRGYLNGQVTSHLPGHYRLQYGHQQQPLVSIIIPTKDQLSILVACVASLMEKTRYKNYELLIVDNNSETPEAKQWLNGLAQVNPKRIRVLRYPHPFNYSAMNNLAAQEARGEYLLLLNNDTAVIQPEWLENMLNHALRPEVGIVGAKLLFPDQRIQHGGVVMGLNGPANHPFIGDPRGAGGYMQRLQVDQNYSAVTAACLLIRKSVYQQVGGLDEGDFKVSYNDIDLCLKVREAGYLTVWTPHATVMHEGSVSQIAAKDSKSEAKRQRFVGEQNAMYEKWLPIISRDPAYNVNLSLSGRGFELESDAELSWRPLSWRPSPVVMGCFADRQGCGHYRIMEPFASLKDARLIDGKLFNTYLPLPVMSRYAPDVVIFQRQISPVFHDWIDRLNRFTNTFKIYELDDYLPNAPLKNIHRAKVPKDVLRQMRKSLGFMDRFVVSTQPLAEVFSGLHADIRVVENKLPLRWWGNVQGLRRQGTKPRVGWGGGSSHTGDLELIADIVQALSDEVEWVFFGMCPEKLRPYVHEFHPGVAIDDYPAKLASLNLDLALAPLEENLFNRCKSNLRLLEYGACGFPVICTDIEPYQCDLPVTRVRNRYKDWMDAIRAHLADLDAAARMGDALQAAIQRDWMLNGDNLQLWRKAWLPD
ncbi:glycosyltransferase [Brenneria sp. 4F2]|nr:glycosyltransferase [Brenneria bubanii]